MSRWYRKKETRKNIGFDDFRCRQGVFFYVKTRAFGRVFGQTPTQFENSIFLGRVFGAQNHIKTRAFSKHPLNC